VCECLGGIGSVVEASEGPADRDAPTIGPVLQIPRNPARYGVAVTCCRDSDPTLPTGRLSGCNFDLGSWREAAAGLVNRP
jgi:hypothetical protein